MGMTKEDIAFLRQFKSKVDDDNVLNKEKIKKILVNNKYIIHALNSSECDEDEPDEYLGTHILPYYMIHPTQTNVKNFICFETGFDTLQLHNKIIKYEEITFYVLCENKNIIDRDTGVARHDLLSALIINQFNWTNYFGKTIYLSADKPGVVDTDYISRTLIFTQLTDNQIVKTKNNISRIINKDIVF